MVLHDSLTAAIADTRRRDLLDRAERFRTARSVRAAVRAAALARRRAFAPAPAVAPPGSGVRDAKAAADRRYAVPR